VKHCAVIVLCIFLAQSPAHAQFRPGGGGPRPIPGPPAMPGGPRPVVPQPGIPRPPIPQPGFPQPGFPQPGIPQAGIPRPGFPQPGFPQPGFAQPGIPQRGIPFNPGMAHVPAPASPLQVRNPFANPASRVVPAGVPIQVTNPTIPLPGNPNLAEFQQARNLAQTGNGAALANFVNQHTQANSTNLAGMFAAVNALHGVDNPAYAQLRNTTMNLAQQQIAQGVNQPTPWVVVAQMSLQNGDPHKFNEATQTLAQKFPDSEFAPFYQGIQHLQNRDFKSAEASLKRARALGMPEESIADLLRVAIDNQRWIWVYAYALAGVTLLWLAGLGTLFVVGKIFSERTLAGLHLDADDPDDQIDRDHRLRALYRWVIAAAGAYYYLSLPMVLILSIAIPLALGYAMLLVPYLNLLLVAGILIVGVGGIVTAVSGLRTAFLRVKTFDNSRSVGDDELPELWQIARQVAEKVDTRPVDEIRLTAGTDLCVFESGSSLARRLDRGKRVLVLGAGALWGMKHESLKAILAHEYGHFRNRDTAGGDIALRVNLAMRNFAAAVVERGKIRWWDVAVHFLRFYHLLFRRLTFGASRLQEVHADRLAVQNYGAAAFREGLTHVIRRSIEFEWSLNKTLDAAVKSGQPATAFYSAAPIPELREREQMETMVKTILNRETDVEDSHPSPKDRFALAARIDPKSTPVPKAWAWALLTANDDIMTEMNDLVGDILERQSDKIRRGVARDLKRLSNRLRRGFDGNLLFARAQLYFDTGDFDRAIKDLTELLDEAPKASGVRWLRCLAHRRRNDPSRALADLEILVRPGDAAGEFKFQDRKCSKDDQAALLLALGECLAAVEEHERAIEAFGTALKKRKGSLAALICRGQSFRALGDAEQARRDFESARKNWPGSPEPTIELAQLANVVR
jgi:tetratricopeptide (TPR) repeat protein